MEIWFLMKMDWFRFLIWTYQSTPLFKLLLLIYTIISLRWSPSISMISKQETSLREWINKRISSLPSLERMNTFWRAVNLNLMISPLLSFNWLTLSLNSSLPRRNSEKSLVLIPNKLVVMISGISYLSGLVTPWRKNTRSMTSTLATNWISLSSVRILLSSRISCNLSFRIKSKRPLLTNSWLTIPNSSIRLPLQALFLN